MKKLFATFFFLFGALLPAALANVPIPLSLVTLPLLVPIIFIEFLIFYLLTKYAFSTSGCREATPERSDWISLVVCSSENTLIGKSMVKGADPSEASMPPVFDRRWSAPFDKTYKKETKWSKILLTVIIANLTTSFLGTFLLANFFPNEYSFLFTAFILSVLIEWGVYILLLRKEKLGKEELLKISILVHAASYVFMILVVYFFAHFLFETVFQFIENIAIFF